MSWWVKVRRKIVYSLVTMATLSFLLVNLDQTDHRKRQRRHNLKVLKPASYETELYIPAKRVVHLDMKGSPPSIDYLSKVLPIIRSGGGTHLLLEWEDMFPYSGILKNITSTKHYTLQEVEKLLSMAEENHLEVIPLIQTLGHMEHVLKLKEFSHLREVEVSPQSICPNRKGSFDLIKEMVNQVLAVHKDIRYIHIGCDEVYQLGECSICLDRLRKLEKKRSNSVSKKHIFLQHVKELSEYIHETAPGVRPIIWDDMLRDVFPSEIKQYQLGELVDIMVWVYVENIDYFIDSNTWEGYSEVFPNIWAASAFKGSFSESLYLPSMQRHFSNQLSWLKVMERESGRQSSGVEIRFQGIALTGWSRYDHFAGLCELLAVSIPSLVLNLVTVSQPAKLDLEVHRLLECPSSVPRVTQKKLKQDPQQVDLRKCNFPGSRLFGKVSHLLTLKSETDSLVKSVRNRNGWVTPYHVRHNFSTPYKATTKERQIKDLLRSLSGTALDISDAMQEIYSDETIVEWIEQNILPLRLQLETLLDDINSITKRKYWPRRPIDSRLLQQEIKDWTENKVNGA